MRERDSWLNKKSVTDVLTSEFGRTLQCISLVGSQRSALVHCTALRWVDEDWALENPFQVPSRPDEKELEQSHHLPITYCTICVFLFGLGLWGFEELTIGLQVGDILLRHRRVTILGISQAPTSIELLLSIGGCRNSLRLHVLLLHCIPHSTFCEK